MKRFSILSFTILCLTTLICLPITAAAAAANSKFNLAAIAAFDEHQKLKVLYENAQERFPDNPRIIFSRGMYYQSQEKFDLAITDFRNIQTMKASDQQDLSLFSSISTCP